MSIMPLVRNRWVRIILISTVLGVVLPYLTILPNLLRATPYELQQFLWHPLTPPGTALVLVLIGPAGLARVVPTRFRRAVTESAERVRSSAGPGPSRLVAVIDWLASRAVGTAATVAVAAACTLALLTWIPHYLTWPWWADTDLFAVSALSWHEGVRPYRDLTVFAFPGPIYLCYLLGKTFGWHSTVPFNAFDASCLVVLGVGLVVWSRRRFGRALPGLVAYLSFLPVYLSLDYGGVGQRDWFAPLAAILGIFAVEAWPGHAGRIAAAAAMAVALTFRPHVLLFLPAMASAVGFAARRPDEGRWRSLVPLAEWAAALALAVLLGFLPLIVAGLFDDFCQVLTRVANAGFYNKTTWPIFWWELRAEYKDPLTMWPLVANLALAAVGPPELRKSARTLSLALLAALVYKPLSPFQHAYLVLPRLLFRSIALAPPTAWLLTTPRLVAPLRLAGLLAIVWATVPGVPRFCQVGPSLDSLAALAHGQPPEKVPPGCEKLLRNALPDPPIVDDWFARQEPSDSYVWTDYCRLLDYLRRSTTPSTPVANFLRAIPWPSINGPTGRMTPFPAAGGILHYWLVDQSLELNFANSLANSPNAVVVWIPNERRILPVLAMPRVEMMIRRYYHYEATFGRIEVWRRNGRRPGE